MQRAGGGGGYLSYYIDATFLLEKVSAGQIGKVFEKKMFKMGERGLVAIIFSFSFREVSAVQIGKFLRNCPKWARG